MSYKIFYFLVLIIVFSRNYGQLNRFTAPGSFPDKYTVYEYKKSNWDGTHASTIFLYVADTNRLESFKWAEGDEVATRVTAIIDWNIFSVKQFENHRLSKGKDPELIAVLKMSGDKKINIEVGPMRDSLLLTGLPWQSYDFDFAGLGFTWRALKDKKSPFWFHIADAGLVNGNMAFINKGRVEVNFIGFESLHGNNCLKYEVNGAGLENKGGHIWINPATFMIEQYKIALPDEPGFENGMLQLMKTHTMTPELWQRFVKQKLGE